MLQGAGSLPGNTRGQRVIRLHGPPISRALQATVTLLPAITLHSNLQASGCAHLPGPALPIDPVRVLQPRTYIYL